MSYRELRNFTETLRALGYPRLISLENFRTPNFPLVSEILLWLVKRYDPSVDLPSEVDTEQDRVIFIKSIAQFLATKANLRLNTKKLYQADGYSVQEILKVSQLLYDAMNLEQTEQTEADPTPTGNMEFNMASKSSELKLIRSLTSEITAKGASIYDLLSREVEIRESRARVLSRQLEIQDIERALKEALVKVEQEILKTNNMIENVAADEASLEAKIEKRKAELERSQKRLQTLKSVRPAFMDEYEKLEQELALVYDQYLIRFRCLVYLEQQLEELERHERELMEERERGIRKMVEKMRQEELLRSAETTADDLDSSPAITLRDKPKRPTVASGMRRPPGTLGTGKRVFGSMTGGADREDSLESDSDLDLDDDEEDASEISDDDLDIDDLAPKKPSLSLGDDDNDF